MMNDEEIRESLFILTRRYLNASIFPWVENPVMYDERGKLIESRFLPDFMVVVCPGNSIYSIERMNITTFTICESLEQIDNRYTGCKSIGCVNYIVTTEEVIHDISSLKRPDIPSRFSFCYPIFNDFPERGKYWSGQISKNCTLYFSEDMKKCDVELPGSIFLKCIMDTLYRDKKEQ